MIDNIFLTIRISSEVFNSTTQDLNLVRF